MIHPEFVSTALQDRFQKILATRMAGLPLLNPQIRVEAVGFCIWQNHCLGILLTPWFMNLMLIACEGDSWSELPHGSKQLHEFPSGSYEFVVAEEEGIGRYQSCSLFSPMFDFASHDDAVRVATEVLAALMDESNVDESGWVHAEDVRAQWQGGDTAATPATPVSDASNSPASAPLSERLTTPISRRELLRGQFRRGNDARSHDES